MLARYYIDMQLSVGLILHNFETMLVCHSHGNNFWDLPKGLHEDTDKAYISTCIREVQEETGLKICPIRDQIHNIGEYDYIPYKKKLRLFSLYQQDLPDVKLLLCTSTYTHQEKTYPEVDDYKYIPIGECDRYMTKNMARVIKEAWTIILSKRNL